MGHLAAFRARFAHATQPECATNQSPNQDKRETAPQFKTLHPYKPRRSITRASLVRTCSARRRRRRAATLHAAALAPAPLRTELWHLKFRDRLDELRVIVRIVRTCSLFRRASPTKNPPAPKGATCPAQRKNFLSKAHAGRFVSDSRAGKHACWSLPWARGHPALARHQPLHSATSSRFGLAETLSSTASLA